MRLTLAQARPFPQPIPRAREALSVDRNLDRAQEHDADIDVRLNNHPRLTDLNRS
jgi:hypothetical protein